MCPVEPQKSVAPEQQIGIVDARASRVAPSSATPAPILATQPASSSSKQNVPRLVRADTTPVAPVERSDHESIIVA